MSELRRAVGLGGVDRVGRAVRDVRARADERRPPRLRDRGVQRAQGPNYIADEGTEAMEFKRTASRLIEMSSESYLALPHGRKDSTASGSTKGLVET